MAYPKTSMPCRAENQLRKDVYNELQKLKKAWIDAGLLHIALCQTYRSGAYQHQLFMQRPRVTKCDSGTSMHEFRCAVDFFNNVAGHEWDSAILNKAGKIAQKLGWVWGGDWDGDGRSSDETFLDRPHLEWLGGLTHAQIRAGKVPKATPSKPVERTATTYTVIAECHCHDEPRNTSPIIKKYKDGDKIKVYSIKNGWAELDYDWYVESKYLVK